jgi:acetylornithine/succinyldiaminopimelate/putrescine aminotransferase
MFIKTLFDRGKILCQMAGNNYLAIKSLPPLIISDEQLNHYVRSVEDVCYLIQHENGEFLPQGLKIAARALGRMRKA